MAPLDPLQSIKDTAHNRASIIKSIPAISNNLETNTRVLPVWAKTSRVMHGAFSGASPPPNGAICKETTIMEQTMAYTPR
jgi:hypothetical protein